MTSLSQVHIISHRLLCIVRLWFYNDRKTTQETIDKSKYHQEMLLDTMPRLFRFLIVLDINSYSQTGLKDVMVCDYEFASYLDITVQFVRKPRKLTDVSYTAILIFYHINLTVQTLKKQLLMRPLSGSIRYSVIYTSQCLLELGQI